MSTLMKDLLEAGVHFGHQTQRWNPKMDKYIYDSKNGIHILDLRITYEAVEYAQQYVQKLVANSGKVLFVGTKPQAQQVIEEQALRAGMPYVNFRWLGGMLTNFKTIIKRVVYLKELISLEETGEINSYTKPERIRT
jgi:small subunit ribosomal protein S2